MYLVVPSLNDPTENIKISTLLSLNHFFMYLALRDRFRL